MRKKFIVIMLVLFPMINLIGCGTNSNKPNDESQKANYINVPIIAADFTLSSYYNERFGDISVHVKPQGKFTDFAFRLNILNTSGKVIKSKEYHTPFYHNFFESYCCAIWLLDDIANSNDEQYFMFAYGVNPHEITFSVTDISGTVSVNEDSYILSDGSRFLYNGNPYEKSSSK